MFLSLILILKILLIIIPLLLPVVYFTLSGRKVEKELVQLSVLSDPAQVKLQITYENMVTLKKSLVLQKKTLHSSKECLRLKQIFYRTGKKLGKSPSLITEKTVSSQIEKQIRFDDLRIRILDFKHKLVWGRVQLKLSPSYYKLKTIWGFLLYISIDFLSTILQILRFNVLKQ